MRNTKDNGKLQSAALNAVLLMGSYSMCGRILTADPGDYALTWLCAAAVALMLWVLLAYTGSRWHGWRKSPLFSLAAAVYFTFAAGLYLRGLAALWRQWALPDTPLSVIAIIVSVLAVYGGSRGIRPVLRLCLPVFIIVCVFFVSDTALLVPEMSADRLRPLSAAVEPAVFVRLLAAMLLPLPAALLLPDGDAVELRPYFMGGAAIGLAYLFLSALRSVLLLGPLTVLEPYPLLRSLMLVYVGPGLSRMEPWGLTALCGAMIGAAMALSACALSFLPFGKRKALAAAAVAATLTAVVFF